VINNPMGRVRKKVWPISGMATVKESQIMFSGGNG
jgi:hypothetical protein